MTRMRWIHALFSLIVLYFTVSCIFALPTSQKNRCDIRQSEEQRTNCINCRANIRARCPTGYTKATRGQGRRGCRYRIQVGSTTRPARGCYHKCVRLVTVRTCCAGFWGQDCQVCPSGLHGLPCSERGLCNDGMQGNGTCVCRGRVGGSACEVCSDNDNQYGPNCEHDCACVNGKCDSGVDRPGSCSCSSGYGGALCDIELAGCVSMNCHVNSRCLNVTGTLQCRCNSGYAGDGTSCRSIDPCQDTGSNLCHRNALCRHTGPAKYDCECKPGYSGDGRWCQAIDPCQTSNGGCPVSSTICNYTGPGQNECLCKVGYTNLTATGCSLIDICGRDFNSTCDAKASCQTVETDGSIQVQCTCPVGWMTRGLRCYTDLLTEIRNANETGAFSNRLNNAIQMFSATYFHQLFFSTSVYTIIAPLDEAFGSELGQPNSSAIWKARARAHIIPAPIVLDFTFESANSMYPLLGYNQSIKALKPLAIDDNADDDDAGYFASLNYANSLRTGHILVSSQWASNGVYYVADILLEPPETFPLSNYDASSMTLVQALQQLPKTSVFLKLWKLSYNVRDFLRNELETFTLLVPTDDAFGKMTVDEMKILTSQEDTEKLDALVAHHIIVGGSEVMALIGETRIQSTSDKLTVNVSEADGIIYIGQENAKVLVSEIPVAGNSFIYLIDGVLVPETLKPLVDNFCTNVVPDTIRGNCGECSRAADLCPQGSVKNTKEPQRCVYEAEMISSSQSRSIGQRLGCRPTCSTNRTDIVCCAGYFGQSCRSCPGPSDNPCYGHGFCNDQMSGSGECNCNDRYVGSSCSVCAELYQFGQECYQNCTCVHGECDNTIKSRGICKLNTCHPGWAGENCDRQSQACGRSVLHCHQHAMCLSIDGVQSCHCEPGYTGDGATCYEFDPCIDDDSRGGCDRHAICWNLGKGNTSCTCKQFYSGDGKTCTAINPCDTGRGGCHQHADCIFAQAGKSTCRCKEGYQGSGLICTEVDKCLENNGGCHLRASCTKTGPGTRDCQCLNGYVGNGIHCIGTLIMEITEHSELSLIKDWIDTIPSVEEFFRSVHYTHVTAFLPRNEAWNSMKPNDYGFWVNPTHLPILLRHHLVKGALRASSLHLNERLTTLLETAPIRVTNSTSGASVKNLELNYTVTMPIPTLGSVNAKIVSPDLQTINGFVHIIDDVLLPPRDVVHDNPTLRDIVKSPEGTTLAAFSLFFREMNTSGVVGEILATDEPYTIFALTNNTFDPSRIASNQKQILEYQVIPGKVIRPEMVQSGQHETTLAGSSYQVTLTRIHGRLYVNSRQVKGKGVRTQRGIVYDLIDNLLTPVKSQCNKPKRRLSLQPCLPCFTLMIGAGYPCGKGERRMLLGHCTLSSARRNGQDTGARSTYLHRGGGRSGCRVVCHRNFVEQQCCPGFYGPGCEPCLGGVDNVCFKQGTCYDGHSGNGTCSCTDPKFFGPACDQCAPGLFGDDCMNTCKCVNGTCREGKAGDGHCVCNKGYTGVTCNQQEDKNDACSGKCHTSSRCYSVAGSTGRCICAEGYSGNGTICEPIDPCKQQSTTGCHPYASCKFRGAGIHQCVCKPGYQGDGTYCSEVNPCISANFSKCDRNADCFHIGPNQSNCICRTGYTGDGKTCTKVNLCENNKGGCHIFATCKSTGPGTRSCKCFEDYVGDGVNFCTGTIFNELRGDAKFSWISTHPIAASVLSSPGPLMAFLPSTPSGRNPASLVQFSYANVVGCTALNLTQLKSVGRLQSLAGSTLNVSSSGTQLTLNGNVRVISNQTFSNGFVFGIDGPLNPSPTLLLPSSSSVSNTSRSRNVFQILGASELIKLLDFTGMFELFERTAHGKWTMFIPTDAAFNKLSSYKKRQLFTDEKVAQEYVKYHMIWPSFLTPTDAISYQELTTLQGSDVMIGCSRDVLGGIVINQAEANVLKYHTSKIYSASGSNDAAFYWIDKVLEPPSVGGRCDIVSNATVDGTCGLCFNGPMPCPTGMITVNSRPKACVTTNGAKMMGCQAVCLFTNVTKKCCDGYYGKDCHSCPGGAGNVCSGNGRCDQGINGTGKCTCNPGFSGYSCELCDNGRFGYNCTQCQCSLHGTCSSGRDGDGSCFCDAGYTGVTCDLKIQHPSTCQSPCVKNAVCVAGGQCMCKPPYKGVVTRSCDTPDLCTDKPNGGCSEHATCSQKNLKVICTCKPSYVGDGYVCEGIDLCNDASASTRCHSLARCVYVGPSQTRCDCLPGYYGDGVHNCDVGPGSGGRTPTTCAVNRGGCSRKALCVDMPKQGQVPRVKCKCMAGFVGDGFTCNGNIFQVLNDGRYEMGKFYQQLLRINNYQFLLKLRNPGNYTLFVPIDYSIAAKKLRFRKIRRHIVSGMVYTTADLKKRFAIRVDSGDALPIQVLSNSSLYINGVRMLTADIPASNGIIHVIEGIIPFKIGKVPVATSTTTPTGISPVSHTLSQRTTNKVVTDETVTVIDTGGLPANVTFLPKNSTVSANKTPTTSQPVQKSSSNGVKVGIAMGIVLIVLVVIVGVYVKKRRAMFVFQPLSERARLAGRSQDAFDDQPEGTGMMNPAYDSTAFSAQYTDAPDDFELAPIPMSPLDEDEEQTSLIKFEDTPAD